MITITSNRGEAIMVSYRNTESAYGYTETNTTASNVSINPIYDIGIDFARLYPKDLRGFNYGDPESCFFKERIITDWQKEMEQ